MAECEGLVLVTLLKLKNDQVNEGKLARVAKYNDEYVIFKSVKIG
jgi:hypothetical protein